MTNQQMTPDQLQWVLDHNEQIRGGHRKQIADAVEAWRAALAQRDALREALHERMEAEHDDATHWPAGSERDGHQGEFATCPHPDCALVREP